MTPRQQILDFYSRPAGMTSAGEFAPVLAALPDDVAALVRVVQGLTVYDVVAPDFYGFDIPDKSEGEIHVRPVEAMLARLLAMDGRPLVVARPVEKRLVSRCRNFVLLLCRRQFLTRYWATRRRFKCRRPYRVLSGDGR